MKKFDGVRWSSGACRFPRRAVRTLLCRAFGPKLLRRPGPTTLGEGPPRIVTPESARGFLKRRYPPTMFPKSCPSWKFWAEGPTERGSRGPSRTLQKIHFKLKNASWAPSGLQVRIFFAICLHFFRTMLRIAFFIVSRWFLNGFWKVWGRFWGCFGVGFFTRFSKNSIFEKIAFSLEKIDKFNGFGL